MVAARTLRPSLQVGKAVGAAADDLLRLTAAEEEGEVSLLGRAAVRLKPKP